MRFAVGILYGLLAASAHAGPVFDDRTATQKINHQYTGGWEHFVGGGVAVFDCDGDLLPEVFAAGGAAPAVLLRNRSGAGQFEFQAGTPRELAITGLTGAYPIDIDSDGKLDLVLLRVGPNKLMRGLPDCRFEPFDLEFASEDRWTTAFSATWEDSNWMPTMAFGNYVDRSNPSGPFEACAANTLYRPDAAAYGSGLDMRPGYCALSMLFSDWSRQGRIDLRISNDRHYYVRNGSEQLWDMRGDPRPYTEKDGWRRASIWGMGIASRDISGDGLPEIFLTSMGDQKLHSLTGDGTKPTYRDAPYSKGITAHRPYAGGDGRPSTGWHAEFGDVDNDGFDDVFVAKGNVQAMPGSAMDDPNKVVSRMWWKFPFGTSGQGWYDAAQAASSRTTGSKG